ncbi:major facilitator superfamily domain-containing protein [Mycena galericulata]|nr:major facilitator superfamily domain-containing protein [Mycena galericulata]
MDPKRNWYNNGSLIALNGWIVLLFPNHLVDQRLGLLSFIQQVGALAGYPFTPYLFDGIDRRRTVFIGALIMVVATAVQTASQSVGMFIGARFLISFGLNFAASAAPMLVTELCYPKYRAQLTSTYHSLWYSGSIVNDPLVRYEFKEIKAAMTLDAAAANAGWTSLLSSSSNRKRIRIIIAIAFFSQWSANGLASFYLNKVLADIGIVNPTTQLLLNGLLSMWSFAWALLASGTAERFGRRALFLTSACFMTLFFTLQTVCFARFTISGSEAAAHGVNVFIFLHFAAFKLRRSLLTWIVLTALHPQFSLQYLYVSLIFIPTKNHTLEETAAIFDVQGATGRIARTAAVMDAAAGARTDGGADVKELDQRNPSGKA